MKKIFALLTLSSLLLGTIGCKTTNPNTGEQEYDPVKTTKVKAALQPAVSDVLRRILVNSPEHATNSVAPYFRKVGSVFCRMAAEKKFDPSFLIEELKTIPVPQVGDGVIPLLTNTAVALYTVFWAQRHTADIPEEAFVLQLADLFCKAIDRGLRDAGHDGIPPILVIPSP